MRSSPEKLDLLLKLRSAERVTWSGHFRPPLRDQPVYSRPLQNPLPVWVAVGGTPESVVRASELGLPMMLAIIGDLPERFAGLIRLYRQAAREHGHTPRLGTASHGFLPPTAQEAASTAFPAYKLVMDHIGSERGWLPLMREQFDFSCSLHGPISSVARRR